MPDDDVRPPSLDVAACAVCARVLNTILDEVTFERIGFEHTVGTVADHPAVPVHPSEIHTEGRCDFCHAPHPAFELPAHDFPNPIVVPGERPSFSRGDWAACAACAGSIRRGRWDDILDRALRRHAQTYGTPPPLVRILLRGLHARLRENVAGPLRPLSAWKRPTTG